MIKMISGTTRINKQTITPANGWFIAPPEVERRLVDSGVAVYAPEYGAGGVATPPVGGNGTDTGENQPDGESAAECQENGGDDDEAVLDVVGGRFAKESLLKMTRANMEKLADDLGVDVKKCKTKSEIADLLAAVEITNDDDGNPPVINPEDPVT